MWLELYLLASHFIFLIFLIQSNYPNLFKLKEVSITAVYITAVQFISIHILLFKNQEYSLVLCKHRKFKLMATSRININYNK